MVLEGWHTRPPALRPPRGRQVVVAGPLGRGSRGAALGGAALARSPSAPAAPAPRGPQQQWLLLPAPAACGPLTFPRFAPRSAIRSGNPPAFLSTRPWIFQTSRLEAPASSFTRNATKGGLSFSQCLFYLFFFSGFMTLEIQNIRCLLRSHLNITVWTFCEVIPCWEADLNGQQLTPSPPPTYCLCFPGKINLQQNTANCQ